MYLDPINAYGISLNEIYEVAERIAFLCDAHKTKLPKQPFLATKNLKLLGFQAEI